MSEVRGWMGFLREYGRRWASGRVLVAAVCFAFLTGGCFGWIYEIIVGYFNEGYVNLAHGGIRIPFLLIYAIGAALYEVLFGETVATKERVLIAFVLMMLVALVLEYGAGWVMLHGFGVQTWDYRIPGWDWLFVSLDGLICARALLTFGLMGLIQVFGLDRVRRRLQARGAAFDVIVIVLAAAVAVWVAYQYGSGQALMM